MYRYEVIKFILFIIGMESVNTDSSIGKKSWANFLNKASEEFWGELCVLLVRNKLLGFFYEYSSFNDENSFYMPDWLRNLSKQVYFNNLGRNKKNLYYLSQINTETNEMTIIKGGVLLNAMKERLGVVELKDIDLLVNNETSENNVIETLSTLGFSQGKIEGTHIVPVSRKEMILKELAGDTLPSFVKLDDYSIIQIDVQRKIEGESKEEVFRGQQGTSKVEQCALNILSIYYSETNLHSIRNGKSIILLKYLELLWLIENFKVDLLQVKQKLEYTAEEEAWKFVMMHMCEIFPQWKKVSSLSVQTDDTYLFFNKEMVGKWKVSFLSRLQLINYKDDIEVTSGKGEELYEKFFKETKE